MNQRFVRLGLLILLGNLAGCSSTPSTRYSSMPTGRFDPAKDPYWEDPTWDAELFKAVQSAVHVPTDPADMSNPGLHAVIKFTYLGGTIEYPEIIKSTGNAEMDELMLHQLASTPVPDATGLRIDIPHEFVLDLDMPTPFEAFRYSLVDAISYWKQYPKEAVIAGSRGSTTVGFDYLDGKASNITVIKSSSKDLDRASLRAVTNATLPLAPPAYAGKTLHLEQVFCYSLDGPGKCPIKRNIILIYGTRI